MTGCNDAPTPTHVVFILTEDQGAHLGALGTPGLETPHLDALASRGVLFTQAFTPYPVCSAAKASIYTGRWPNGHGLAGNTANFFKPASALTDDDRAHPLYERSRIVADVPTLIEVLSNAGFTTAITHKLHVLPVEKFPFDVYQRTTSADDVRALIDGLARRETPFFLMLNLEGSHRPFTDSETTPIGVDPAVVRLPGHLPDTPIVRRDWAEYLDSIERTDALVGVVLEALADANMLDDTLIVFTSDHGPSFQRGKMSLHDLGVHVPAIVAGPGVRGGHRSEALVSHVDWAPTLLDLLGLFDPPNTPDAREAGAAIHDARFDGRSLAPLLAERSDESPHSAVFSQIDHEVQQHDRGMRERSVQDGRFRLIWRDDGRKPRTMNSDLWRWERWRNRTYAETLAQREAQPEPFRRLREVDTRRLRGRAPRLELYDLARDPDELVNLAALPEMQPERERLLALLREHARTTATPTSPRIETTR